MPSKKHRTEKIIGKLREAEVILAQGAANGTPARIRLRLNDSDETAL